MTQIILIIIGVVIAVILLSRKGREEVVGMCAVVSGRAEKKREIKEKIMTFLSDRGEASNAEIRGVLGVSSRSVVRYLDELEKEGKIKQVGDAGRGVVYRLSSNRGPKQ